MTPPGSHSRAAGHFQAAFHGTRPLGRDPPPTSPLARDTGVVSALGRCGGWVFRRGNVRKPPGLGPVAHQPPLALPEGKSPHLSPVPSALLESESSVLAPPPAPAGGSSGVFRPPGPRGRTSSQLPLTPSTAAQAVVAGAQVAPGAGWRGRWEVPGSAASESWLPGASPGAEQCGHFRKPLCPPLYAEEQLPLCGAQSARGPDFPPLPEAQRGGGFPGSRPAQAAGHPHPPVLGPVRSVHISSSVPGDPAVHTGRWLAGPSGPIPGHTPQAVPVPTLGETPVLRAPVPKRFQRVC